VPFARRVEELAGVLHVVAGPRRARPVALEQPHARGADEADGPCRPVQAPDRQPLADPVMEDDDVDVLEVLPRPAIARAEDETVLALEDVRAEVGARHRLDDQQPLVRVPGPGSPLAVDPELVKRPFPLADPGEIDDPARLVVDRTLRPAADLPASAEH